MPNSSLQALCLVMSSVVVLGLPTGMPFHRRGDTPVHNPLWLAVGPRGYAAFGVCFNLWVHLLVACLQIFQAAAIARIQLSSGMGSQPWLSCIFIGLWILFSETVVKRWSSRNCDGTPQFPYGPLMKWPTRPLFYTALVSIASGFTWLYSLLNIL